MTSKRTPAECTSIEEVRAQIDRIDRAIVSAIAERRQYVQAIMRFKQTEADVQAPQRQQALLQARRCWAEEDGLNPDLVEALYRELVAHFVEEELETLARRGAN